MKDNRNYSFPKNSFSSRPEYQVIIKWIPANSNIVDLGCGDGSLLKQLSQNNITGEGMDISLSAVLSARKKGMRAKLGRIDQKLPYKTKSFDYAICNVTLQMVMYPEILISEMVRISNQQIFSFPNIAFVTNRLDLLLNGRMPRPAIFGYSWFSTGHIHHLSVADFEIFCHTHGIEITKTHFIYPPFPALIGKSVFSLFPNLFASIAIYQTK